MSSFIEQRRDPLLSEDFFLVQLEDYKESLYFDQEWWSWINDPHHERWSDPAGLPTRSGASEGMFRNNFKHNNIPFTLINEIYCHVSLLAIESSLSEIS